MNDGQVAGAIPALTNFPMSMSAPDYRTAGIFLLLTALATAISVPARLAADADLPTLNESLAAIGAAKVAYGTGGAARLVGGVTLVAAAVPMWRAMYGYHPVGMGAAAIFLVASGLASIVSGAAATALAATAPTGLTASELVVLPAEEAAFAIRWIAGTLGFTLAGLGLVALAPVQWRMGGILRLTAVVDAVLGVAMLFIWVDAATAVHRVTGVAFLIWLIVVGLWLVIPRLRTIGMPASAQG